MTSNWKRVNESGIGDVTVAADGRVWTAGKNGTVWYSDDQGNTTHQISGSGFSRLAADPNGTVWGIGTNGSVWNCSPSLQWTQALAAGRAADATVAPNGTLWITLADGSIQFSKDRGQTFNSIVASGFLHLSAGPDNVLWAVGANGTLWHYPTTQDNATWTQTAASGMLDVGVEWAAFSNGAHAGRVWLVGKNGTVWLSIDSGASFTQKTDASGFSSIAGAGTQTKLAGAQVDAWAVGANGTLWARMPDADYQSITGTPHFSIQYDTALGAKGRDLAERLSWITEGIYAKLSALFGGIQAQQLPILLTVDALTGGGISGVGSIDIHTMGDIEEARYVFVSELAEIFMRSRGAAWNPNDSKGEALSRLLGAEAFPIFPSTYLCASSWLNSGRIDYVSKNFADDKDFPSFGCAILFLNYLHRQLGYSLAAIIQDNSTNLAGIYKNLTGKSDAFAAFSTLLTAHFPPGKPVSMSTDNPFPL
jgi:photosystem II stability/assembly factor-like uncharacterized protein